MKMTLRTSDAQGGNLHTAKQGRAAIPETDPRALL